MEGNFVKASKLKLRFKSGNGNVSVEDLWDLPLENVDAMAIGYSKELDDSSSLSFIKPKRANTALALKFEITKFVIETRVAEAEARKTATEKAAKRTQIRELMEKKQLTAMEGKSLEELQKELDLLEEPVGQVATA